MAPKKGKRKQAVVEDDPALLTEQQKTLEMSRDQLEDHIMRLREELSAEKEQRMFFQTERDRMKVLMTVREREMRDKDDEIRAALKEMDDMTLKEGQEVQVYKRKIFDLIEEGQRHATNVRIESLQDTMRIIDQSEKGELSLMQDMVKLIEDEAVSKEAQMKTLETVRWSYDKEVDSLRTYFMDALKTMSHKLHSKMEAREEHSAEEYSRVIAKIQSNYNALLNKIYTKHKTGMVKAQSLFAELAQKLVSDSMESRRRLTRMANRHQEAVKENKRLENELSETRKTVDEKKRKCKQLQEIFKRESSIYFPRRSTSLGTPAYQMTGRARSREESLFRKQSSAVYKPFTSSFPTRGLERVKQTNEMVVPIAFIQNDQTNADHFSILALSRELKKKNHIIKELIKGADMGKEYVAGSANLILMEMSLKRLDEMISRLIESARCHCSSYGLSLSSIGICETDITHIKTVINELLLTISDDQF